MSKTKIVFLFYYEVILIWQDIFIFCFSLFKVDDLSYFFSNQEGSVLPVDSKNVSKSFVEATYNDPGSLDEPSSPRTMKRTGTGYI